jgi:hypothetical protein
VVAVSFWQTEMMIKSIKMMFNKDKYKEFLLHQKTTPQI